MAHFTCIPIIRTPGFRKNPFYFKRISRIRKDCAGSAAIEAAFVIPLLLAFVSGIFNYGWYFFLSHNVQQLTQDAARASIAGLDPAERIEIIDGVITRLTTSQGAMSSTLFTRNISESGDYLQLRVTYDASRSPFAGIGLVPLPSNQIVRSVTIRLPD